MAEEIKEVELEKGQTQTDEPKELTIDEIKEQIRLEADKKYKELLSGRDRANTDLKKELLATKTAEEQAKFKADEERKEWLRDVAEMSAKNIGLEDKFSGLIKGNSKDELKESADLIRSFKESITKDYEKQIKTLTEEINILKANGTPPPSGQGAPTNERERLIGLYNEAEKKGDGQAMFALKEQIQKLPK
jgi:hypothetical protein